MIQVIASIRVRPGSLPDFLSVLKGNLAAVRNEKGCIEYFPAIDSDANLPAQVMDRNVVTILEKWEDVETLHRHLGSAHMLDYREKVKSIVENVSIKVLQEVH